MKNIDSLIDEFVKTINAAEREPFDEDEVPSFLRTGDPDEYGQYDWKIVPMDCSSWVDPFTAKLPKRLPPSFLSLITHYAFPAFELGPILLFSNTGQNLDWELSKQAAKDKPLSSGLYKNGFLQIGNPWFYNYDPVCFDGKAGKNNEYPIVQICHESILCDSKIRVVKEIAPSFESFIEDVVGGILK